jgi:hypothetical protein
MAILALGGEPGETRRGLPGDPSDVAGIGLNREKALFMRYACARILPRTG